MACRGSWQCGELLQVEQWLQFGCNLMSLIITRRGGREKESRLKMVRSILGILPLISPTSSWGSPEEPAGGRVTTNTKAHARTHTDFSCVPVYMPPPGLTFTAKCCNGWLFMLRGLMMRGVQQVAALHCLSERRSGIITSWTILNLTHKHACTHTHTTSVFLLSSSSHTPFLLLCVLRNASQLLFPFRLSPTDVLLPSGHL